MHSLKESSQIEQDADIILILALAEHDKPDSLRILNIAKNKDGAQCKMPLHFDGPHQTFTHIPPSHIANTVD